MAEGDETLVLKDSSLEDWDRIWSGDWQEHSEGQESGAHASEGESEMFESKVQR